MAKKKTKGKRIVTHKSWWNARYTLCGLDKKQVQHTSWWNKVTCKRCKDRRSKSGDILR